MVKLASTLPKEYDDNGLESNTRHLLDRYTSQKYTAVVALVHTKDVHHTENFERVPRVEVVAIEGAFDDADADEVRALLTRLHDKRVKHVKQPLNLPDDEPAVPAEPLELEASTGVYMFVIVDEQPGKFGIAVLAPSGALAIERHNLPRDTYGELPPGEYQLAHLDGELAELAAALVQDYEQGLTTTDVEQADDVVDAEVVDDEPALAGSEA